MKLIDDQLILCIELFSRTFIIIWVIYLTATKTNLFDNNMIKPIILIVLFLWAVVPATITYIDTIERKSQTVRRID